MLQLKMLLQPTKLQPKKLHLLKMQWLPKKLHLLKMLWQPKKLLLQTKLQLLQKKLLPSKPISEIPFGELEEGQSGNWLALFFVPREPIRFRPVDVIEGPILLLQSNEGITCVN